MARIKNTYMRLRKITFVIFGSLILTAMMLVGLLSYKPLVINTENTFFNDMFNIQGHQLRLNQLTLWFDGSLHVRGEKGRITSDAGQTLNINKIEVEFSTEALLFGVMAPKHLLLDGLALNIRVERDAFVIAGFPLKTDDADTDESLKLIDYLNLKGKTSLYYDSLKTIKAHNIHLNIQDDVNAKSWNIKDGDVMFNRSFRTGETLDIYGVLARPFITDKTPVHLSFKHKKYAETARLDVKVKNVSSQFFDDYIPFKNPIQAKGDIQLGLDLLANNVIENTQMIMEMQKGTIHASAAYNFPFEFKSGYMDVNYSNDLEGLLTINKLSILDREDWPVEVNGTISHLLKPEKLDFNLNLKSLGETTISHVASYLPDKKISGTTNWIRNNVHESRVKNLRLTYKAMPSKLPLCDKKCGFDGSFDFTNMSLSFLKNTGPATGLNGHFEMKDDYIKITSKTGDVEGQKVKNLDAVIAGHFTEGLETGITINGEIDGKIQGLLDIIERETKANEPWGIKINGNHSSKGSVYIPFKDIAMSKVQYDFATKVEDIETDTIVKDAHIIIPEGDLTVTEKNLKLTALGTFNGTNVSYDWRENMQKPIKETLISVHGDLPAEKVMDILKDVSVEIVDKVPVTFSAKATGEGLYDYTFLADLQNNVVSQKMLDWKKPVEVPLTVIGKGVFKENQQKFPITLSAEGENVDIKGKLTIGKNIEGDFSKFDMAGNKLKVAIKGNVVNIVGEQLNLAHMDLLDQNNDEHEGYDKNFHVTLNVQNALLKGGNLQNLNGRLERAGNKWVDIELSAEHEGQASSFTLRHPSEDHMSLRLNSYSAGGVFKAVDATKSLRGGHANIRADIYTTEGKREGRAYIKIDDVHLVEAPVLAKLLSLISLTELFSAKEGIYFDDVEIPLLVVGDEIIVDHASLSGPSIGLRLKGKINTESDALKIDGQLIPAEGINSFISNIPLIGTLLTGSQEGLLVADFSVKGTLDDTKVSANPLSFVFPGILKDFFGTLFGKDEITKPSENIKK